MAVPYYQRIARASDLPDPKERRIYRMLEMFPATLAWGVVVVGIIGAWLFPVQTAFAIILFVLYWIFRLIYLGSHLVVAYRQVRANQKLDWEEKLNALPPDAYSLPVSHWKDIYHIVFVPTYNESFEILRQSIQGIAFNNYPKDRIILVLGIEERAGKEAQQIAGELEREFKDSFSAFLVATHPADLPGEIPGKGSNEAWAAKKAKEFLDAKGIPYKEVFSTSLDADTVVGPQYFTCLTYHILTTPHPLRSSFQPVPVFLNNVWDAPAVSRVFAFNSTFWHMMNQQRPEKLITFSSHSMPFQALVDVDFHQTNVVSEDSRIFWQCLFRYEGDYRTVPFFYPVSMDANAAPTLWRTIQQVYKQQRRWAYGTENVPYSLFGFWKSKKISIKKAISYEIEHIFGFWSWATASLLIFLLGWLPLFLGGDQFSQSLASYNLPHFVSITLRFSMIGVVGSMYMSILLLPKEFSGSKKRKAFLALQWLLLPMTMLFASLPALEAQTRLMVGKYMGFWPTPKWRGAQTPTPNEGALSSH